MLPEWLNVGKPHYTEEGGPENSRNTSKSVSQLETQLESAPVSPSSRTGLRPSLQRSFHPTGSFGYFFGKVVITLSNVAFLIMLNSKYVAYLVLYVRQDCHQLLQRLVAGPQLHSAARRAVT